MKNRCHSILIKHRLSVTNMVPYSLLFLHFFKQISKYIMGPLDLLHSYEKGFWIVNDSDLVWGFYLETFCCMGLHRNFKGSPSGANQRTLQKVHSRDWIKGYYKTSLLVNTFNFSMVLFGIFSKKGDSLL